MSKTKEVRALYIEQGYDCIPLKPLSKLPLSKGWQNRDSFRQWKDAGEDVNFGLRAGQGKAFIDCDTKNAPATADNTSRWLQGLGITNFPIVQTPSGGTHIYLSFSGALLGSKRNLLKQIGAGEFRYGRGAYVAAPPSVIETGVYKLIEGDITQVPTLDTKDIAALINLNESVIEENPAPKMSALARALANGTEFSKYQSRSEAEAALVLSLVNSGFNFQQIKQIFDTSPVFGKYAEMRTSNTKKAEAHLLHTYNKMLNYSQNESPTRRKIKELQELAELAAWSKPSDKIVFLAHSQIAYKVGRYEYAASSRDLALEAGLAGNGTAMNATRRLIEAEFLKLQEKSAALLANRYALQVDKITHFLTSKYLGSVSECPSPAQVHENGRVIDLEGLETADAFRNGKGRLGRRAGQVYKLLFTASLTNSEIAKRTGASVKTIGRILKKLATVKDYKTGEIIEMVARGEDEKWISKVVDLDILEAIFGTRGAREKQRMDYEQERRDHRKDLQLGGLRLQTVHTKGQATEKQAEVIR